MYDWKSTTKILYCPGKSHSLEEVLQQDPRRMYALLLVCMWLCEVHLFTMCLMTIPYRLNPSLLIARVVSDFVVGGVCGEGNI